jgi:hypothetical protein
MGELNAQLHQVLCKLKQVLSTLDSKFPLRPSAHLEWDSVLDNSHAIALQFRSLISSVPQEFRHFVVHPTRCDEPTTPVTIDTLLCDGDITELISENALYKQRFREQIDEMGLATASLVEREGILLDQVHDHNTLIEAGVSRIRQLIDNKNLKESRGSVPRATRIVNTHLNFLKQVRSGDGLPVAPDLIVSDPE